MEGVSWDWLVVEVVNVEVVEFRVDLGGICSKNYLLYFLNIPINNTYYSC